MGSMLSLPMVGKRCDMPVPVCWRCCACRARDPCLAAQAWVKILTLAFLVVGGSCGLLIPVMLYVLDLRSEGWTWQYCALFGSMVASTDAVAIVSTMKASEPFTSLYLILNGTPELSMYDVILACSHWASGLPACPDGMLAAAICHVPRTRM